MDVRLIIRLHFLLDLIFVPLEIILLSWHFNVKGGYLPLGYYLDFLKINPPIFKIVCAIPLTFAGRNASNSLATRAIIAQLSCRNCTIIDKN